MSNSLCSVFPTIKALIRIGCERGGLERSKTFRGQHGVIGPSPFKVDDSRKTALIRHNGDVSAR